MFKLTKDSAVVNAWFTAVVFGWYTIDQVPTAWGLREAVQELLNERDNVG